MNPPSLVTRHHFHHLGEHLTADVTEQQLTAMLRQLTHLGDRFCRVVRSGSSHRLRVTRSYGLLHGCSLEDSFPQAHSSVLLRR